MQAKLKLQKPLEVDLVLQEQLNYLVRKSIDEHTSTIELLTSFSAMIVELGNIMVATFMQGNKIFLMGNGGSAADAQHIAAELVGRFSKERSGLPAIALTTDTSILTSVSNDYSYNAVFSRQVEALAKPGDLVIGISTSGKSSNVLVALEVASKLNCFTAALLGKDGGLIKDTVDIPLIVPSSNTARIQEAHILIGHLLCEIVDSAFSI
ncbi:phosphoheptose isomerase [Tolypothrix sp. NIES-4075]|uniref:D-sedoheptulose 7-phosphate isomerase n=1 Tax=Tolypothrix sp. NIES-4075 TaxID=2005459 RepID=UPI000B5CE9E2|nr:D-sedoheptulose 7-phosphate isomerase [Tolypothrix sp. NIES-4075]GAX44182.1 phosphoheptose isomerase [Tolypothrix sp. NIES-4075]